MSFVIYGLIGLMPGDPDRSDGAGDPDITSADVARLKAVYGLDRPLLERYGDWLGPALPGELGYSRSFARPVLAVLPPRLANTFLLMGVSFVLALCHRAAARHPGRDRPRSRRLRDQPVLLRRHLDTVLLARPAADHLVLGRARLAAGGRRGRHPAGRLARALGERCAFSSCRWPRSPGQPAATPASCAAP